MSRLFDFSFPVGKGNHVSDSSCKCMQEQRHFIPLYVHTLQNITQMMIQLQSENIILNQHVSIDNDDRWTPVPDDPIQARNGMTPNSRRQDGEDKEYEDTVNQMRRATTNMGCKYQTGTTLGVTYSTMYPPSGPLSPNYNPRRQTITVGLS